MDSEYKCPGCGRNELHISCPAYGTPFYMTGIPYLVELAKIYMVLDPDDKIVLFDALSKVKIELFDYQKQILEKMNKLVQGDSFVPQDNDY